MAKDLRTFLAELDRHFPDEMLRVKRRIDPGHFELSAVLQHLDEAGKVPVVLFEQPLNLLGQPSPFPTVYNLFGTRQRCATALDHPRQDWKMPLSLEFSRREQLRIPPVIIPPSQAPVKEVVQRGQEADVRIFPAARYHAMDIGPYFVMACVMRHPQEGFYEVSFAKNLIKGARDLSISLTLPHLKRLFETNEQQREDTPVIIVLGHHPAFYLGALALTAYGNDDYDTIGAFLAEPLRLTPSETWGDAFLVPADAEIVIEGTCPAGVREIQNPFGEISGHYQPQGLKPVVQVTALSHRGDAILQGVFPGHQCHFNLGGIPKEGSLYNALTRFNPNVTAVHLPHSGCSRMSCYIAMKKKSEGEAKRIGLLPFVESTQVQLVVVVDDDIDVFNERQVIWSMITSARPSRDYDFIKNMSSLHSWMEKVLIDATRPLDVPFPQRIEVPRQIMDKVRLSEWL